MRFCALSARARACSISAGLTGGPIGVLMLMSSSSLPHDPRTPALTPYGDAVPGSERWIDLVDPDATAIEAAVSTHVLPMDVQRLLRPTRDDTQPRPRLAAHGDYVFGVL